MKGRCTVEQSVKILRLVLKITIAFISERKGKPAGYWDTHNRLDLIWSGDGCKQIDENSKPMFLLLDARIQVLAH